MAGMPVQVGEKGTELFIPQVPGSIVPHNALAGALGRPQAPTVVTTPPPQVNVHVINVSSQAEALSALDSREGEEKIMNVIQRNKSSIRRNLQ
jgi:hypothetical protein